MAKLLVPLIGPSSYEVAQALVNEFGSIGRALAASEHSFRAALPKNAAAADCLLAARTLTLVGSRENVVRAAISPHDPALHEYLRLSMAREPQECVRAIFVDPEQRFIAEEALHFGLADGVTLNVRLLVKRAFSLGATGVILAHNHPSGSAEPSAKDIASTRQLKLICDALAIHLIDHLIVGGLAVTSMHERGSI